MSLHDMIKRRHSRSYGWRVVFEVPLSTPDELTSHRQADAIAVGENGIHGFEVKCCRWDLERELATPKKSEPFRQVCNYWWLVCDFEIWRGLTAPEGWGVLCPDDKGQLYEVVDAPRNDVSSIPIELAYNLIRRREIDIYQTRKMFAFSDMLMFVSGSDTAKHYLRAMEGKSYHNKWRIAHGFEEAEVNYLEPPAPCCDF
jgi:hypothetical protein